MESATVHILNSNESTLGAGTRSADKVLTPGALPLSLKTRFRGPLVAQTSIGRLAQPWGAESASRSRVPANEHVQRRSSSGVVVPDSACHAGGRGFESRRSR